MVPCQVYNNLAGHRKTRSDVLTDPPAFEAKWVFAMLRPLEASDYDTVAAWLDDRTEFANVLGDSFDYPLERDAFIEFFVIGPRIARNRLCFKWCENDSHVARGMISYTRIEWKNDYGHIGYVAVAPELRSRGIGKAMVEATLKVGFTEYEFHRIDLFVLEENTRALRFYEYGIGFSIEGLMRDIMKRDGGYTGQFSLSMLKDEWSHRKAM